MTLKYAEIRKPSDVLLPYVTKYLEVLLILSFQNMYCIKPFMKSCFKIEIGEVATQIVLLIQNYSHFQRREVGT